MSHTCTSPKISCSGCRACDKTRFVELVKTKTGDVKVRKCSHCDWPQGVRA